MSLLYHGGLSFLSSRGKWQRRYYGVSQDGSRLIPYHDGKMEKVISLDVLDITSVHDSKMVAIAPEKNGPKAYAFVIHVQDVPFYFSVTYESARDLWVDILKQVVRGRQIGSRIVLDLRKHSELMATQGVDASSKSTGIAEKRVRLALSSGGTHLDLSGMEMTQWPATSAPIPTTLPHVTELDISFNRLTELPHQVVQLTKLSVLSAMGCQFVAYPPQLSYATLLTELNFNGNGITSIPREIGYLSNLEKLNLQNNNLHSVSPLIDNLRRLEELNLSGNPKLKSLPQALKNLQWLQFVDLSDCSFETFPEELTLLPRLLEINVANNRMKTLSKDIGRIERLAQFNCADNLIERLPSSLGLCAALRGSANQLNIARNPLADQNVVQMLQASQLGIENVMDYLEEAMIEEYGGFPRYEDVPEPTPAIVLSPLSNRASVALNQPVGLKKTSGGGISRTAARTVVKGGSAGGGGIKSIARQQAARVLNAPVPQHVRKLSATSEADVREVKSEWASTTLQILVMKVQARAAKSQQTQSLAELRPFVMQMKNLAPILPKVAEFVTVPAHQPPPHPDKIVRAKYIVYTALTDFSAAVQLLHNALEGSDPKVNLRFYGFIELVEKIKSIFEV